MPALQVTHCIRCFFTLAALNAASVFGQLVHPESIIRSEDLAGTASAPRIAIDFSSGFITWVDGRAGGSTQDVYAQKVDVEGNILWTADGSPITVRTGLQYSPALVSDNAGGAVVVWVDNGDGPDVINGLRISEDEAITWNLTIAGLNMDGPASPRVHQSDEGNFILSYLETNRLLEPDTLVVQKIDGDGQRLWGDTGVDAITQVSRIGSVPDGSGGLVVFGTKLGEPDGWLVQRVTSEGTVAWSEPVEIAADLPGSLLTAAYASDGVGGILITYRNNSQLGFVVRVASDGSLPWGDTPLPLSDKTTLSASAANFSIAGDGNGGAYIAWMQAGQFNPTTRQNAYLQHLSESGEPLWGEKGSIIPNLPDSALTGVAEDPVITSDGFGGIYIIFKHDGIRAQRLNGNMQPQWNSGSSPGISLDNSSGIADPILGRTENGLLVYYDIGSGFAVQAITAEPDPLELQIDTTSQLPDGDFRIVIRGGSPQTEYDILRSTDITAPLDDPAWTVIATARPSVATIDADAPVTPVFYVAKRREP